MQDLGAAFNLRKFPPDQRERFVNSVTRGKNQMPPWGDFFKPEQLEALWAYVMAGEPILTPSPPPRNAPARIFEGGAAPRLSLVFSLAPRTRGHPNRPLLITHP